MGHQTCAADFEAFKAAEVAKRGDGVGTRAVLKNPSEEGLDWKWGLAA
jgi:hypothetical protein